jgi:hypothetical protein
MNCHFRKKNIFLSHVRFFDATLATLATLLINNTLSIHFR